MRPEILYILYPNPIYHPRRMDRLHKKRKEVLDSTKASLEPQNVGPLQSTIKHIRQEITDIESQNSLLQKQLSHNQSLLVGSVHI